MLFRRGEFLLAAILEPHPTVVCHLRCATALPAPCPFIYHQVLILDYDLHHGNGTCEIFYDDPSGKCLARATAASMPPRRQHLLPVWLQLRPWPSSSFHCVSVSLFPKRRWPLLKVECPPSPAPLLLGCSAIH